MKFRFRSIMMKALVPVVAFMCLSSVILVTLAVKVVRKNWHSNYEDRLTNDKNVAKLLIEAEVENSSKLADELSKFYIDHYEGSTDDAIADIIYKKIIDSVNVEHFAIFGLDSKLITPAKYARNTLANYKIKEALSGKTYDGIFWKDGRLFASSVKPVYYNSKIIAAIEVSAELSTDEFVQRFSKEVGCEFSIIKEDKVAYSSLADRKNEKIDAAVYDKVKAGQDYLDIVHFGNDEYFAYYWPLGDENNISLFVGENFEAMKQATSQIYAVIFWAQIISTIILAAILNIYIFKFVIRPLKKTSLAIEGLSSGEADLTYRLKERNDDEITDLTKGVNKFIEMLQHLMKSIFAKLREVNDIVNELGASSQETASATAQIMANIESVKNQSRNQVDAVGNTNDIITNSNSQMKKLEDNIVAQAADITESSAAIEQMIGNIHSVSKSAEQMADSFAGLKKVIQEGAGNVKSTSELIKQVEEKSRVLIDANNTIKSIASQTNLLAMNAMIESAHAGEAGKGFAVVADEIRKLAEDSSSQAQSIDDNIKDITDLITEGGRLSSLSQESFENIDSQVTVVDPLVSQISNAMEEQTTGSSQILESLTDMKNESALVDDSAKSLASGITGIEKDMTSVNTISTTVLDSMDEMAAGSQQISQATQNVSDLSLKTKDAVDNINELISKFKVE